MTTQAIRVSVIGKNNHAARHIQLIRSMPGVVLQAVLYHKPADDPEVLLTTKLEDLLDSDAIIIASPTPTHAAYLKRLSNYGGYVLVEKPAVSTDAEARILLGWPDSRIRRTRINFNLLHSDLAVAIRRAAADPRMERVISFDVHTSHGLAFRPQYRESWRSQLSKSGGVLETVGVHYVNLASSLFGPVVHSSADFIWAAGEGTTPDTAVLYLRMGNGVRVTLRHSYAAPVRNHFFMMGTGGIWEFDGRIARMRAPRDSFDEQGRFTEPAVVDRAELDFPSASSNSLKNALADFTRVVRERGTFDPEDFRLGVNSMMPINKAMRSLRRNAERQA